MRKPALYSRTERPPAAEAVEQASVADVGGTASAPLPTQTGPSWCVSKWVAVLVMALLLVLAAWLWPTTTPALTQKDIDAAVLRTLTTQSLPSMTALAAEKIRPSVVRVSALIKNKKGEEIETGVGSGVVIVDKGVILTNLHVVQSAQIIRLTYADGSESDATVRAAKAEQDLAVLQAHTVPDDLLAATLRSTHDLLPGQAVIAVGFPFGIGPSVSSGVISGLGREFKSPEGEHEIANLIQFDAAANPGNSGGPLVTMDGEVVGIVTGILNPSDQKTFVGIGFAVPIESAAAAAGMPPF